MTNPGDTFILFVSRPFISLIILNHGPEFQAVEELALAAYPFLPEEHWSPGIELYQQGGEGY